MDAGNTPAVEQLVMGLVMTSRGMNSFAVEFPFPHLVDCMAWDSITHMRSATIGPLSCVLLEAEGVGGTQLIMPIPCIPVSATKVEFAAGARVLQRELISRVNRNQISVIPGDLTWLLTQ